MAIVPTFSSLMLALCCEIPTELASTRLDKALAQLIPEHSRERIQSWILNGEIQLNQEVCTKPKTRVQSGDRILIQANLPKPILEKPQEVTFDVVAEDPDFLIINKPAGLVVHPGAGVPDKTLVNGLLARYPELSLLPRAGIIHRLDKGTTGLLIVARNSSAHTQLVRLLQQRQIKRHYLALVVGQMISGGEVNAPIGRDPHRKTKMAIVETGKPARTHYRIHKKFRYFTLLDVHLDTGRTHQIRVHLSSIKNPLVGDPLYGQRLQLPVATTPDFAEVLRQFKRPALHAATLEFEHPRTQELVEFSTPLPEDFQQLLEAITQDNLRRSE